MDGVPSPRCVRVRFVPVRAALTGSSGCPGRTVGAVTSATLAHLPLARASVPRAAERRTEPDVIGSAVQDPRTRVLLVRAGQVLTQDPARVLWLTPAQASAAWGPRAADGPDGPVAGGPDDDAWLLLGQEDDGGDVLALRMPDHETLPRTGAAADAAVHQDAAAAGAWRGLRAVGAALDAHDAGLATTAVALDTWHDRQPRCPRCGAATRVAQAGWSRVCVQDGSEHYPRTDPAVIMAVVDDADRLLLGHAATWAPGRFSTLAGFVEAGESAERAVRREVLEEAGVQVGEVVYRGSQPWPFPGSLMLGYRAHATSTDVRVDGVELTDARWFTRDELAQAVLAGDVVLPSGASIARALVEEWFGGPVAEPGGA
ncbi:NAD(+) diphosphatase [Cellulomonas oligotrophica]|uniref:NAD(+) diphosphatase n=1 Tax=Cellulomonas oligotrophica TaxID=931536 RepID=A0ABQ4DBV6_9CELL|nr:hypothetical protein Col01nite_23730 [Cellulomonas oligotrophica]